MIFSYWKMILRVSLMMFLFEIFLIGVFSFEVFLEGFNVFDSDSNKSFLYFQHWNFFIF